ncbi:MAG: hypothetical protein ACK42I_03615 [Thermomicrobium sp.]
MALRHGSTPESADLLWAYHVYRPPIIPTHHFGPAINTAADQSSLVEAISEQRSSARETGVAS